MNQFKLAFPDSSQFPYLMMISDENKYLYDPLRHEFVSWTGDNSDFKKVLTIQYQTAKSWVANVSVKRTVDHRWNENVIPVAEAFKKESELAF